MKLIGILTAFCSNPDTAGNVYWAFRYTGQPNNKSDILTAKPSVCGTISGGESNLRVMVSRLEVELGDEIYFHIEKCPIRLFDKMIKNWDHAGCTPAELEKFVLKGLKTCPH